jgi:hypothetical protein
MRAMWFVLLGVSAAQLLVVGCQGTSGTENLGDSLGDDGPDAPLSITDGTYELQVDRQWDGEISSVRFPSDLLTEADYQPVSDGPEYSVIISDLGRLVSVGDTPMEGQLESSGDDRINYALTGGTFAGGRFIVWVDTPVLQAELTIYGSGLPIVMSERGRLVPRPPAP